MSGYSGDDCSISRCPKGCSVVIFVSNSSKTKKIIELLLHSNYRDMVIVSTVPIDCFEGYADEACSTKLRVDSLRARARSETPAYARKDGIPRLVIPRVLFCNGSYFCSQLTLQNSSIHTQIT